MKGRRLQDRAHIGGLGNLLAAIAASGHLLCPQSPFIIRQQASSCSVI
jgi:hypothetical protein